MKIPTFAIPLLSSALLAACGGGGDGGAPATPVTSASLSSANQTIAAQEATSTVFLPLFSAQTLVGAQATDESVLFRLIRQQLAQLPAYWRQAGSASTLTGVVQTDSYSCSFGGSVTVSVSDTDNDNLVSAGDSATITGANCAEPEGTFTGALGLTITSLSGIYDSTSYKAGIALSFNNLTVSNPQYSASLNGSLSLNDNNSGPYSRSQTFASSSLTVSASYGSVLRTRSLSAYSATVTRVPDAVYVYLDRYSASGVLSSSALASQSISFSTSADFVARAGDIYPYSGAFVIGGAGNSRLRLNVLSSSQLTLELDANGDGNFEGSSIVNWNTLL